MPIALIGPDQRRELDRKAKDLYDEPLEALYAHWAYWTRRGQSLRSLPWVSRHRLKGSIREADHTATMWLERIRLLWSRDQGEQYG